MKILKFVDTIACFVRIRRHDDKLTLSMGLNYFYALQEAAK
jgi:hypothetical protein